MRINHLLNTDDTPMEASPAPSVSAAPGSAKKGLGRGNWRRNKPKQETVPLAVRGTEPPHHVPLLPNNSQPSFIHETPHAPIQPATPVAGVFGQFSNSLSQMSPQHGTSISFQAHINRDHVPTPSYQAQKRNRGMTQHQSAVVSYRKQQIDYMLDKRISKVHARARGRRESEGCMLRAWKRIKLLPTDYDSEEEHIKIRKSRDKADKDDDWRVHKGKESVESPEELEAMRRPRVLLAGIHRVNGEVGDVGEEARSLAKTFRRASRRLERWQESNLPGHAMIRRRYMQHQGFVRPQRRSLPAFQRSYTRDHGEERPTPRSIQRHRSSTGRTSEHRAVHGAMQEQRIVYEPEEDEGGGELDEEDRELLGEVDPDESEDDDEDEDMGDD